MYRYNNLHCFKYIDQTWYILRRVWNPIDVQGQGHWVKFLPCSILVNTLESTSFNGF